MICDVNRLGSLRVHELWKHKIKSVEFCSLESLEEVINPFYNMEIFFFFDLRKYE